jgi:adenylate cyclase, class 2
MAIEIEAKMKVDDLAPLRRKLARSRARRVDAEMQTNIFFDRHDGSLRKGDKGLRIRVARVRGGDQKCTVTLKGPLQPGKLKSRDEIEFSVDDPKAARALLENLGFALTLSFQKRRETWKFKGCEVSLDELPRLGCFVEIEGPSHKTIMSARRALGLSKHPLIQNGYVSMLSRRLAKDHVKTRNIRF